MFRNFCPNVKSNFWFDFFLVMTSAGLCSLSIRQTLTVFPSRMYPRNLNNTSGRLVAVLFIKIYQSVWLPLWKAIRTFFRTSWKTISFKFRIVHSAWSTARSSDSSVERGLREAWDLWKWRTMWQLKTSERLKTNLTFQFLSVRFWYAPSLSRLRWIVRYSNGASDKEKILPSPTF